jgi:hypothetical protein
MLIISVSLALQSRISIVKQQIQKLHTKDFILRVRVASLVG